MGKSTPSVPSAAETAAAQTGMNRDTAITQMQLNSGTTVNPWGTTSSQQTGTQGFTDSRGKWVETPTYTQTTTLSPSQQAIFDQTQAASGNLAGIAKDQSAFLKDYLNQPFSYSNQDAEQWAYDRASPRILEQQSQNEATLRTTLANKGIAEGSAAWNAEMARLTNANTDQMNQLELTGRQQGFSESLATRNQPLNEISALMSGSQVSNPSSMSSAMPQASVGGVDYASLVQNQYEAESAKHNAMMGGLFGIGSSIAGAIPWSDRRLKTNIRRFGSTKGGTPIYSYNYIWGGPMRISAMAQDVPHAAILTDSGFYKVDFEKVA